MKILLLGKNGQVGWELQRTLAPLGEVFPMDYNDLDISDSVSLCGYIRTIKPDIIVNGAAYTLVDQAEQEAEQAMAVNGTAPGIMAEEARRLGALLIHYSTDYIFDGKKSTPYSEDDLPNPINVYGHTKLAGERNIVQAGGDYIILRTCWVYGSRGNNFYLTMLKLFAQRQEIKVVDDQTGSPTWCRMLAGATGLILARGRDYLAGSQRIYHLSAAGSTSWYGFARAIHAEAMASLKDTLTDNSSRAKTIPRAANDYPRSAAINSDYHGMQPLSDEPQKSISIIPVSSSAYPAAAARPLNSVLSNDLMQKELGIKLPRWDNSLQLMHSGSFGMSPDG